MIPQKALIFDSGTLISLAMSALLPELRELRKLFNGKFLITEDVKREVIDKPLNIKRFELEAMKIQSLLDDKVLELPVSLGIKNSEIQAEAQKFMEIANGTMYTHKKEVHLIHLGESSCLALSKILSDKGIKNIIAVDERTTRLLSEKPENLRELMERKLHIPVQAKKENYKLFRNFKFIRSTELMYVAYKKGVVRVKNKDVLDALLYSLKFKGAAISGDEIREIKKIG